MILLDNNSLEKIWERITLLVNTKSGVDENGLPVSRTYAKKSYVDESINVIILEGTVDGNFSSVTIPDITYSDLVAHATSDKYVVLQVDNKTFALTEYNTSVGKVVFSSYTESLGNTIITFTSAGANVGTVTQIPSVVVDDALSETSTNPVQNKAIYAKIKDLETAGVTVDAELSETSENPVQNKIIAGKIKELENIASAASLVINVDSDKNDAGEQIVTLVDITFEEMEAALNAGRTLMLNYANIFYGSLSFHAAGMIVFEIKYSTSIHSTITFTSANGNVGTITDMLIIDNQKNSDNENKFLMYRDDDTEWATPPNATTTTPGYMSAEDKAKLDSLSENGGSGGSSGSDALMINGIPSADLSTITVAEADMEAAVAAISEGKQVILNVYTGNVTMRAHVINYNVSEDSFYIGFSLFGDEGNVVVQFMNSNVGTITIIPSVASDMTGAAAGAFLQNVGDGFNTQWVTPPIATQTSAGYMSAADKINLDNLVAGGGSGGSSGGTGSDKIQLIIGSTSSLDDGTQIVTATHTFEEMYTMLNDELKYLILVTDGMMLPVYSVAQDQIIFMTNAVSEAYYGVVFASDGGNVGMLLSIRNGLNGVFDVMVGSSNTLEFMTNTDATIPTINDMANYIYAPSSLSLRIWGLTDGIVIARYTRYDEPDNIPFVTFITDEINGKYYEITATVNLEDGSSIVMTYEEKSVASGDSSSGNSGSSEGDRLNGVFDVIADSSTHILTFIEGNPTINDLAVYVETPSSLSIRIHALIDNSMVIARFSNYTEVQSIPFVKFITDEIDGVYYEITATVSMEDFSSVVMTYEEKSVASSSGSGNTDISSDNDGELSIADEAGNVIMRVDANGLETTTVHADNVKIQGTDITDKFVQSKNEQPMWIDFTDVNGNTTDIPYLHYYIEVPDEEA